ncbi:MAG: hypothetical protein AAGF74_13695 [Pseudomonadota bacterium]
MGIVLLGTLFGLLVATAVALTGTVGVFGFVGLYVLIGTLTTLTLATTRVYLCPPVMGAYARIRHGA